MVVNGRRISEIYRKVFKLFYHQERGTGVLSELFKIAVRNSISLLGLANVRNKDNFASLLYIL